MKTSLPEFDAPPLDEVVIGVQFEPLANFSSVHLGAFWSRIRDHYPGVEDNAPLQHQKELSEVKPTQKENVIHIAINPRCWFLTKDRSELIQLQRDQFFRNWRRALGTEVYPRYDALIGAFRHDWKQFKKFVSEENLGPVKIDQCELTYINQIERGIGWESFSDVDKVFTCLSLPTGPSLLATPEMVAWASKYKLPAGRGRMHVEITPAFRGRDFQVLMSFNLKVRGAPADDSEEAFNVWYDEAHELIVKSFDAFTTSTMHSIWKKRS